METEKITLEFYPEKNQGNVSIILADGTAQSFGIIDSDFQRFVFNAMSVINNSKTNPINLTENPNPFLSPIKEIKYE